MLQVRGAMRQRKIKKKKKKKKKRKEKQQKKKAYGEILVGDITSPEAQGK